MEDKTILQIVVVAAGTVVGGLRIAIQGDGDTFMAMVGLYGAVLGFNLGNFAVKQQETKSTAKAE